MTANGWIQILFFFAAILLGDRAPGGVHVPGARGQGPLPEAPARLAGAARLPPGRSRRPRAVLAGVHLGPARLQRASRCSSRTPSSDCSTCCPSTRRAWPRWRRSSAFNTAASFTTNTNWQGYVGEATMSYLSQMAGLAWHNFISAAAGIAVAMALARGLTRRGDGKGPGTIGNFWVDLTRSTVYVLLPLSVVFTLVFVSQGMIQNFSAYPEVDDPGGRQAGDRHGAGGLPGGHQAARGRTAAGSSTATPPTPSRARTRSRTSSRCS